MASYYSRINMFYFEKCRIVDTRCKKIGSQRLVWFSIALKMLGSSGLIMVKDLDLSEETILTQQKRWLN